MARIPLFIHAPCAPSVDQAMVLLDSGDKYVVHLVPFDLDLMKLIYASRPCAAIFSITNEASADQTFRLLEQFKNFYASMGIARRDPRLRTILVAENWDVPIELWEGAGIHEYIPAPVSKKSLDFKLARHFLKATTSTDTDAPVPKPEEEIILVKGPGTQRDEYDETVYRIPASAPRDEQHRPRMGEILISAIGPALSEPSAIWIPGPQMGSFEQTWIFKSGKASPGGRGRLVFAGDKPKYDTSRKAWLFRGSQPALFFEKEGKTEHALIHTSENGESVYVSKNEGLDVIDVRRHLLRSGFVDTTTRDINDKRPADDGPNPKMGRGGGNAGDKPKEVEAITSFLDSWKPKITNLSVAHGAKPLPINDATGTDHKASLEVRAQLKPAEVVEGYYSGPGLREGYAPKPESHLDGSPSHKPGFPAPKHLIGAAPVPKPTPGENRLDADAQLDEGTLRDRRGKEDASGNAGVRDAISDEMVGMGGDALNKAFPTAPPDSQPPGYNQKGGQANSAVKRGTDAIGVGNSDGASHAAIRSSGDMLQSGQLKGSGSGGTEGTGGKKSFGANAENAGKQLRQSEEGGKAAKDLNVAPEGAGRELRLNLKGEGPQDDNSAKAFSIDDPEGKRTWSMQTMEESGEAAGKSGEEDPNADSTKAAEPALKNAAAMKAKLPGAPAGPSDPSLAGLLPGAALPPDQPENGSWLARFRRLIKRVFWRQG